MKTVKKNIPLLYNDCNLNKQGKIIMNHEFGLFMIVSIVLVCMIFYTYNTMADKYNKNKIRDFLKERYLNDDFRAISLIETDDTYSEFVKSFGKSENFSLDEKDQEVLTNLLGFEVKPYDKIVMPYFFGGTLYCKTKGYEDIKVHHIVFRVYKKKYICNLGEKEYFFISVERHHGTCHWDGKEMHYPYRIEDKVFECTLSDFKQTWLEVKKYMFA